MDEVKKVITIQVHGDETVKSLKEEINLLRDTLLNTEKGTEDYQKTLDKLIDDQKRLTEVMNAGKKEVQAAAGSYNALQQEMTALKKVWKEVSDEAARNEIGVRINAINDQLKEMDASIGNFQRNVGNYEGAIEDASKNILQNLGNINPALTKMGRDINQLIPLIKKTTATATTGLKGIKKAITATGIGALITALGLLVANWDKVANAIRNVLPWTKKANEEIEEQNRLTTELIEKNKLYTEEMDFQARIMQAQGKSALEIIQYKKQETDALLANTEAQIEETKAKIESLKAHSAFGRWIRGERKQLKGLEENLETLVKEQESLANTVKKLGQDLVVEQTKVEYGRTSATTKASRERIDIEKYEHDSRLDILKDYLNKANTLEESYYTEEQKLAQEHSDKQETAIKGMYANILKIIKDSTIPKEVQRIYDSINLDKLPPKAKEQVEKLFKNLDLSKSGNELTNEIRQGLDKIDLSSMSASFEKKFKTMINGINVSEISDSLSKQLDAAFSNTEFDDIVVDLKAIFGDNEEYNEIIQSFSVLWKKIQDENDKNTKELNEKRTEEYRKGVNDRLQALELVRKQEEKNAIDAINLELKRKNVERGEEPTDRIQALKDEQIAENAIFNERRKSIEEYISNYKKALEDEKLGDEGKIAIKKELAQKEIELNNLITENKIVNAEIAKDINNQEKENLEELVDTIADFSNKVGDILGSIADYWLDYVEGQIKAGKMSQDEGKKQFKWIKELQIAQTTIQTLAAAMAAFNGIVSASGGWGVAAAAAEMAAVLATGAMQIAKIKATQLSSSESSTNVQGAQVQPIQTNYEPTYVAAQTGESETANLRNAIAEQPIYVNVVEVENMMNKRNARVVETNF